MSTQISYTAIGLGASMVAFFGLALIDTTFAQGEPPIGQLHEGCCCIPAHGGGKNPNCNTRCQTGTPSCNANDEWEAAIAGDCYAHETNSCTDGYFDDEFTVYKYACGPSESCSPPTNGKRCKSEQVSPPDSMETSVAECSGGPCGADPGICLN
jgi:hypothetical protein